MTALERGDLLPRIVAPPPGPRSRGSARASTNARGARHQHARAARRTGDRLEEALGANVLDVDGNRLHRPDLRLRRRRGRPPQPRRSSPPSPTRPTRLVHGLGDVAAHPSRVELAERLAALAPVDDAARLLRRLRRRRRRDRAQDRARRDRSHRRARLRARLPRPDAGRARRRPRARTSARPSPRHLRPDVVRLPFGAPAERIAGVLDDAAIGAAIVEPVVGREGVLVPPPGWLGELAAALSRPRHGCSSPTRSSPASDAPGPDSPSSSRASAPTCSAAARRSAAACRSPWWSAAPSSSSPGGADGEALHTGTFVAHPLACAAALATLELYEREGLAERARELGARVAAAPRGARRRPRRAAPSCADGARSGGSRSERASAPAKLARRARPTWHPRPRRRCARRRRSARAAAHHRLRPARRRARSPSLDEILRLDAPERTAADV